MRQFLLNFLQESDGTSSSCRLVGVACGLTACVVALIHPMASATVAALGGGTAVSLLVRSR